MSNVDHMRRHYASMHEDVPLPEKWVPIAYRRKTSAPPADTKDPAVPERAASAPPVVAVAPRPLCPHCLTPQTLRHQHACPSHPRLQPGRDGPDETLLHLALACPHPGIASLRDVHFLGPHVLPDRRIASLLALRNGLTREHIHLLHFLDGAVIAVRVARFAQGDMAQWNQWR